MIASDGTIRFYKPVEPFVEKTVAFGMTYGLGSAGYDIRIAESMVIYAHGFALASSVEHFNMPPELLGIVHDKSTWSRLGLAVQNCVIEPGWRGHLTFELSNHSSKQIRIHQGMPIAQIVFHLLNRIPQCLYNGKYQDQPPGPQEAKFDK